MPYRNNEYETPHNCKLPGFFTRVFLMPSLPSWQCECGQKWHWIFFTVTKNKKVGSGVTEITTMEWGWRKC